MGEVQALERIMGGLQIAGVADACQISLQVKNILPGGSSLFMRIVEIQEHLS